ncbi:MAG: single-stranded-DNA-specific exonuclease RecJ [Gammaproteobacteria bacterium]|nr:single-stranded-DNA-specific exonuclease RecJ [Gammaproteobacteria bacterium]
MASSNEFIGQKKIVQRKIDNQLQLPKSLHPILAKIFSARALNSADELQYSLDKLLPYHSLLNINSAVELLSQHLEKRSHILIVADFDADGATSCAVAIRGLSAMGAAQVSYVVPNRFEYGYGLTPEIVAVAARQQPDLIITVDNGISSVDGVHVARKLGIDVLITDHHLPGKELPNANAIVNPNQAGDPFASKYLAGVGVMFYVLMALRAKLKEQEWFATQKIDVPNLAQWLDLVALGTVADVVPLDYNNRILVEQGLRRIRQGHCSAGISAMLQIAGRNPSRLSTSDLGFAVGPRLNAAGRLQDMKLGIECLLSDDLSQALRVAQQLDDLNKQRRDIESQMRDEAIAGLDNFDIDVSTLYGVCVYQQDWHQGVVGLVAARVREHLHRPVIAFANSSDDELKGSARSIPGLHIRDALDTVAARYPKLINKFGGHAMAAGLSLWRDDYQEFSLRFNEVVSELLRDEDLQDCIHSDGELDESDLNLDFAEVLRHAGPWGQHFPEPLFDGRFELVQKRIVGNNHLKMTLRSLGADTTIEAIAFNTTDEDWPEGVKRVRAAYKLDVNEYRGQCTAQLLINHISPEIP